MHLKCRRVEIGLIIQQRDTEALRQILQLPAAPGCLDREFRGRTLLSLAVEVSSVEAVRLLVDAGADVNRRSRDQLNRRREPPLLSAVRLQRAPLVDALLQVRANADETDWHGHTPLWAAMWCRDPDIVHLLTITGGARLHSRTAHCLYGASHNWQLCPIHLAAREPAFTRQLLAIQLLRLGARAENCDLQGRSALWWAERKQAHELAAMLRLTGHACTSEIHMDSEEECVGNFLSKRQPPELRHLSRLALRQCFRHCVNARQLFHSLKLLQLPNALMEYVLFEHDTNVPPQWRYVAITRVLKTTER